VWRYEQSEVMATNRREPPVRTWSLRAPEREGTYVLEIQASWEPEGRESSRLGRLIRRRKPAAVARSAVRRVIVTVFDPKSQRVVTDATHPGRDGRIRETEVDSVDLGRSRTYRPLASGRSPILEPVRSAWAVPTLALIEPSRRDRLRGWIHRSGAEAGKLDPKNESGLAWSAVGLKVAHPDRPHRLTVKIKGGEPRALGVAVIEPGDGEPQRPPRVLLDACAAGPPVLQEGPPLSFSWLVWPGSNEAVLLLVNRDAQAAVRLGTVTLTELDGVPPALAVREPDPAAPRTLGLYLDGPHALDPFGDGTALADRLVTASNLEKYLGYCGATAVILPEDLAERSSRRALGGQAAEDSTGPDRLETVRRVLARGGMALWIELSLDSPSALADLPPADSADAVARGLVRVDGQGRAEGPFYHPLHPEVREAMKRRVAAGLALTRGGPGGSSGPRPGAGLVIRLGSGPTLLGTPESGADDATFDRFVRETFSDETARKVPGRGTTDGDRFAVRMRYLAGVGRMPWLTWRSRAMAALYRELAGAAQAAAPGALLAVVTPGLDDGPAGTEARRVDLAGLAPSQAWRSVGLDQQSWPGGALGPVLLRGVALSTDPLAGDLSTSPDLDAIVAGQPRRGLLLLGGDSDPPDSKIAPEAVPLAGAPPASSPAGPALDAPTRSASARRSAVCLRALPLGDGRSADSPLGHAVAALDAQWVFLAATAVAGHEERVRGFAAVLRSLPAWPASAPVPSTDPQALPFGTAVRRMGDHAQTFLEIANDSPYPIRVACLLAAPAAAAVEDLGRGVQLAPVAEAGGRNLVLDLLPFGVSAIRVGAPGVRVASVSSYPSDAVLAGMQARYRELIGQLSELNRGLAAAAPEPANPGFEPDSDRGAQPELHSPMPPLPDAVDPALEPVGTGKSGLAVPGWRIETAPAQGSKLAIDRDNPHSGVGSLRLEAAAVPAAVVSESFVPSVQTSLTIQAFFRSEPAGAVVRVWIEGQSDGHAFVRRSELAVSSEWSGRAARASDLPPLGLDSARLRIELLTPGTLWIDDVRILNDPAQKAARQNAQGALLAAVQAYREMRYADFARLASSHWVRQLGGSPAARLARAAVGQASPGAGSARPGDAAASALPPDRKLR
jgi:hypothetical protein